MPVELERGRSGTYLFLEGATPRGPLLAFVAGLL
jgi:hypothetical protein